MMTKALALSLRVAGGVKSLSTSAHSPVMARVRHLVRVLPMSLAAGKMVSLNPLTSRGERLVVLPSSEPLSHQKIPGDRLLGYVSRLPLSSWLAQWFSSNFKLIGIARILTRGSLCREWGRLTIYVQLASYVMVVSIAHK